MLRNARNVSKSKLLCYAGCSCHNSKQDRRKVKHSMKRREQRQWQRALDKVPQEEELSWNYENFADESDWYFVWV